MPSSDASFLHQTINRAVQQVRGGRIAADFDESACRSALMELAQPLLHQPPNPIAAAQLNAIGLRAAKLLQHDLAIQLFTAAVAAAPAKADYHLHLASAHRFAGELPTAVDHYRTALQLQPDWPKALSNLAEALDLAGHGEEAIAYFNRIRQLTGDEAAWQINLGTVELHRRHDAEAIAAFRSAIALVPTSAVAHYKLAWALLATGQWDEGWQEYEWRTPAAEQARRRERYPATQWRGEDLVGKTLLLEAEQGIGDMLQFVRYAPQLAAAGVPVVVECPGTLRRLLSGSDGIAATVGTDEPLPQYDFHVLPMSLPLHLRTIAATIAGQVPYLSTNTAEVRQWGGKIGIESGDSCRRIGLAWAGNRLNRNDSRRSCPVAAFDRLADFPNCRFFSLQKPQLFDVGRPSRLALTDHAAELHDFADTAAFIENLDLVITVDTAIAHLAGALAKPVWILLPHFADWRWQWHRSDSPWYPTARLFRQPAPGDWSAVLESVATALRG